MYFFQRDKQIHRKLSGRSVCTHSPKTCSIPLPDIFRWICLSDWKQTCKFCYIGNLSRLHVHVHLTVHKVVHEMKIELFFYLQLRLIYIFFSISVLSWRDLFVPSLFPLFKSFMSDKYTCCIVFGSRLAMLLQRI